MHFIGRHKNTKIVQNNINNFNPSLVNGVKYSQ